MDRAALLAVIGQRYDTSTTQGLADAVAALAHAEQKIWDAHAWRFKVPVEVSIALVQGQDFLKIPAGSTYDVSEVISVQNEYGDPLDYKTKEDFYFDHRYDLLQGRTGRPDAYTVIDDDTADAGSRKLRILWNLKPDLAYTWSMLYERALLSRTAAGTLQNGPMAATDDVPYVDAAYHMAYAYEALLSLLAIAGDPGYDVVAALRDEDMERMVQRYCDERPPIVAERVWGRRPRRR